MKKIIYSCSNEINSVLRELDSRSRLATEYPKPKFYSVKLPPTEMCRKTYVFSSPIKALSCWAKNDGAKLIVVW
jgi:hypothetical protein